MAPARKRRKLVAVSFLGTAVLAIIALGVLLRWDELMAWLEFRRRFESLGPNSSGAMEYAHRETAIVFVEIPAGTVLMGCPEDEEGALRSERSVHEVRVDAFLIAKREVSEEEWGRVDVVGGMGSYHRPRAPMAKLSWHDWAEFNDKAGFSFPTEAEWERACRGGTSTPFAFGSTITTDDANFNGKYPYGEAPTGEYRKGVVEGDTLRPNPFGLHHMHGNLAEWCEDIYDEDFYARPDATARNAVCRTGSGDRSVRGGSWRDRPRFCRSASRSWADPEERDPTIGYRPVYRLGPSRGE